MYASERERTSVVRQALIGSHIGIQGAQGCAGVLSDLRLDRGRRAAGIALDLRELAVQAFSEAEGVGDLRRVQLDAVLLGQLLQLCGGFHRFLLGRFDL